MGAATSDIRAQLQAGVGLWVLGALNIVGGLAFLAAGVGAARAAASIGVGALLVVLGFGARRGSRPALLVAVAVLALLMGWALLGVVAGDPAGVVRLLVAGVLLWLVVRALRAAAF